MATVDNSTQLITSTESGTGWSVDVTNANLDPLLTLKDFIVKFDNVVQSNVDFTKTSQTIITYNGVAIGSTTVTIQRDTPNERVKCLTFGDRLQSAEYEAEFNRVHKLINDSEIAISESNDVKVTIADTTPGTLENKIVEGADVLLSVLNPGANEQLQISVSSPTSEPYVDINSALVVPNAVGTDAIAIGGGITADGTSSIVVGTNSLTDNADFATDNCIVIGNAATIDPTPTTGSDSSNSIAIGNGAAVNNCVAGVALGNSSEARTQQSVAVGGSSEAANQGTAVGFSAEATGISSTGVGANVNANGLASCGVGSNFTVTGQLATVIGTQLGGTFSANRATVLGARSTVTGSDGTALGALLEVDGTSSIGIGSSVIIDNADFSTNSCIAIGDQATIDPTPTTGAASDNSIAIGTSATVLDAANAVQIGTGTNSTASTLQFLGNRLADANGLVNNLVNEDITSGVDITITPGVSNDRLFVTPTANINLILLTAGATNTTHFTFVNLDPGTFNIDVKIDLVGNPTILTLGGGLNNISVGYTGTDYRFYG